MSKQGTDRWRLPLAGLFSISSVAHFVRPDGFASIVPPFLGPALPWVYASGVGELACAVGLLLPSTTARRRTAYASAMLLVVVFPANLWMAWEACRDADAGTVYRAVVLARLPLQVPLVLAARSVARAQPDADAVA